jgi:hypothetical protein
MAEGEGESDRPARVPQLAPRHLQSGCHRKRKSAAWASLANATNIGGVQPSAACTARVAHRPNRPERQTVPVSSCFGNSVGGLNQFRVCLLPLLPFWPFIQISSNDAMLLAKTQIFAIGHGFDQSMSNAGDLRNVLIDWGDYFIRINPHKIFWILATSHVRALHLDAPQSNLRTRGS